MNARAWIQRHAVATFFGLSFLISYGGFVLLVVPKLLVGQSMQPGDAEFILFPIIVIGVCLTGIALTAIVYGRQGLRDLRARQSRWRVAPRWYAAALFIPPLLILAILLTLRSLLSPIYTPNAFWIGFFFGLVPGFLEEIGWTGFALPSLRAEHGALTSALWLGLLWGLWHAPVVDYLGAAAPHGPLWFPFFLSFVALISAMRVLMVWIYTNTNSLLLTQIMHVSSTASLVVLDPSPLTPAQETLWYALYAALLWIVVAFIILRYGSNLIRRPQQN
jgi:membrane protease YdiL (CAAX protease family)